MRSWRVGTLSMGATLLLLGLGLLYAQINEQAVLEWAVHWWPLVFIFLGVEVLWQSYQARKMNTQVSYDILGVFLIGLMLCLGLALQALSETGVLQQCKVMLTAQNYELQQNALEIPLDKGLQEVVIQGAHTPLQIFSRPSDKIAASVNGFVSAPSRSTAKQILRQSQSVNTRREGNTLYLSFNTSSPISHLAPGLEHLKYTLYLPQQIKVSVHSEYADIDIHAQNILNDWYIKGAQRVGLDMPATANVQLAAQVNSQEDLQGNAAWSIKEIPSSTGSDTENEPAGPIQGSLSQGTAQHKMIINSNSVVSVDILP